MTIEYKLQVHSRNVMAPGDFLYWGKHTGFDLVKYVDGVPVSIESVDLTTSELIGGNIGFQITDVNNPLRYEDFTKVNQGIFHATGQVWGNAVLISDADRATDMALYEAYSFETTILNVTNPVALFSQIKFIAEMVNRVAIGPFGDPAEYNFWSTNCNSFTQAINEIVLGGINFWGNFEQPDGYSGLGSYTNFEGWLANFDSADRANIRQIKDIYNAVLDYFMPGRGQGGMNDYFDFSTLVGYEMYKSADGGMGLGFEKDGRRYLVENSLAPADRMTNSYANVTIVLCGKGHLVTNYGNDVHIVLGSESDEVVDRGTGHTVIDLGKDGKADNITLENKSSGSITTIIGLDVHDTLKMEGAYDDSRAVGKDLEIRLIGGGVIVLKGIVKDDGTPEGDLPSFITFGNENVSLASLIKKDLSDIPVDDVARLDSIRTAFSQAFWGASTARDPLVVDLNKDGRVTTTALAGSGVYFDHDGDGFAERTAWIGAQDGFLVRDINGNGQIDDGRELFGTGTVLKNGEKAKDGFEALRDLDTNGDGVFDWFDDAYAEVKVWQDKNGDGKVDAGELLTLEEAGIGRIDLNWKSGSGADSNGNTHGQSSTFGDKDVGTRLISDVWLQTDGTDSKALNPADLPDELLALPDVAGFGRVPDLREAMALDGTGRLQAAVEEFMAETDYSLRHDLLTEIAYLWAGVYDVDPASRAHEVSGNVIGDARIVATLEAFMGQDFVGTWTGNDQNPNPHQWAAPRLIDAFTGLADYLYGQLMLQTHYKPLLEGITLTWNPATNGWDIDVAGAASILRAQYGADEAAAVFVLKDFGRLLKGYGDLGAQAAAAFRALGDADGAGFDLLLAGTSRGIDVLFISSGHISDRDEQKSRFSDLDLYPTSLEKSLSESGKFHGKFWNRYNDMSQSICALETTNRCIA